MIKLFTPILFLFLFSYSVNAQVNSFEPAYVIQGQDTIKGYIKSASDLDLSKGIQFKSNLSAGAVTEYGPGDISGFRFENTGFYYATVKAEIFKGTSNEQHERFAKQILSGYSELYKLQVPETEQSNITLSGNTHIYVLKKENEYFTLGLYESMNGVYAVKNKRYIGMLRAAFSDCENLELNFDRINFSDRPIMDAVAKYNACKNPALSTTYHEYKAKALAKHGVEVAFAKLYVPKNSYGFSAQGYAAGYFVDIIQPDASRKYSTKLGVSYMYYLLNSEEQRLEINNEVIHYLRFPLAVQYNLKDPITSGTVPFFNVGFTAQLTTDERFRDFIPLPSIGIGMYSKRIRYAATLENDGFKLSNPKILSLSLGLRLDK